MSAGKKRLFWLLPAALLALLAAFVLALPAFVAATTHRQGIENFASKLVGRNVRIQGKLSLALLPAPELIAGDITITGPDQEVIKARSLTLDLSLSSLARGRLSVTSLALEGPEINFPWPLPGGPQAIAPPSWLAALHGQVRNGTISLGAAHFTGVDADIFTGTAGAVTITGTGTLDGQALVLNLVLQGADASGFAPLTLAAQSGNTRLQFAGGLSPASRLSGALSLFAPKLTGHAGIIADAAGLHASALTLSAGETLFTGSAALDFGRLAITASLAARNLDLAEVSRWAAQLPQIPLHLELIATGVKAGGRSIPALRATADITNAGIVIQNLQLGLAGGTELTATARITPGGALTGQASLTAQDFSDCAAAYGFSVPQAWQRAALSASLGGTTAALSLGDLSGMLGAAHLHGMLRLAAGHAAGTLDFDRLDLQDLRGARLALPENFTADGDITAAQASFGPVTLTHLLLDAAFTDHWNIRRVSAALYHGLAAGGLTLDPQGDITAAHGFLLLPSASPLAALLPVKLPAGLLQPQLSLIFEAQGPPHALATSALAQLGDFTLTAAPMIDMAAPSLHGPLTLRHPSAAAALALFGLARAPQCGRPALPQNPANAAAGSFCGFGPNAESLAWPGPGSLALRANITASATQSGLPDFVLSLGALNASGRLLDTQGVVTGQISAGTLPIPALPGTIQIPWAWLGAARGSVDLTAQHLVYAGTIRAGPAAARLSLAQNHVSFSLADAAYAGGTLTAALQARFGTVALPARFGTTAPPALSLTFQASQLDAARLVLPLAFPFSLASGRFDAAGSLTANGYSPKAWLATLAGQASLSAADGSLAGFALGAIAPALAGKNRAAELREALGGGATGFASLHLAASLAHGNATLSLASLAGAQGTAEATGSIDLFDQTLALELGLAPALNPPLVISSASIGGWAGPQRFPRLQAALAWTPAPGP